MDFSQLPEIYTRDLNENKIAFTNDTAVIFFLLSLWKKLISSF